MTRCVNEDFRVLPHKHVLDSPACRATGESSLPRCNERFT
jgi:hypothetical protein